MSTKITDNTTLLDISTLFDDKLTTDEITYLDDLEYQGFNVQLTFQKLRTNAVKNNLSKADLKKHLIQAVGLYLIRGTNVRNMTNKMNDAGKSKLDQTIRALGIEQTPNGPDSVTLHRLASLFPNLAFEILTTDGTQPTVMSSEISKAICFPQAPALLPDDSKFKEGWKKWYIEFSETINKKTRGYVSMTSADAEQWWQLYNQKSLMTVAQKQKYEDILHGKVRTPRKPSAAEMKAMAEASSKVD